MNVVHIALTPKQMGLYSRIGLGSIAAKAFAVREQINGTVKLLPHSILQITFDHPEDATIFRLSTKYNIILHE